MAFVEYKPWYIKRDDDGFITECAVRFYEGDYESKSYIDPATETLKEVTVFRRDKQLTKAEMSYFSEKETKAEVMAGEAIVFTEADFGRISSDDELNSFLKKQIANEKVREIITSQKE